MVLLGAPNPWPWPIGRPPAPEKAELAHGLRVQYFSLAGQNREMLRAMLGAMPLLLGSIGMVTVYLAVSLGKRGPEVRHSKIFIGMIGCSLVGMAAVITVRAARGRLSALSVFL